MSFLAFVLVLELALLFGDLARISDRLFTTIADTRDFGIQETEPIQDLYFSHQAGFSFLGDTEIAKHQTDRVLGILLCCLRSCHFFFPFFEAYLSVLTVPLVVSQIRAISAFPYPRRSKTLTLSSSLPRSLMAIYPNTKERLGRPCSSLSGFFVMIFHLRYSFLVRADRLVTTFLSLESF